jgi:hypothetical protein
MAGLDPAIHLFAKKMDALIKSAHDGEDGQFANSLHRLGRA